MPRPKKKTTPSKPKNTEKKESSSKKDLQLLRGMKDIMPQEQAYWNMIRKKVENFAKIYGFERIDVPVLEQTSLFVKGTGKHTDIVEKEMFSFEDQGGEKVSLRPEFTPSIVRAYIEHGMLNQPQPVKLFSFGPVFRHDKPQAGRYRQFYQMSFEIIGSHQPVVDAELLSLQYFLFKELGLNVSLQINSVGCPQCRPQYKQLLQDYYRNKKRNLCENCKKRYTRSPMRLLDCKEEVCQELAQDAPQIVDHLCEGCREHFVKVLEHLDTSDIPYTLNSKIVRGLDYYTRTAWEIFPIIKGEEKQATQGAVSGGGRYDGLVEQLGGREETGGCGFAAGVERLILALKDEGVKPEEPAPVDVFLAQLGETARKKSLQLLEELRQHGFQVRSNLTKESLSSQLGLANKLGARITLILGQKEMIDNTILLRDMESGAQEIIDLNKIEKELNKRLANLKKEE